MSPGGNTKSGEAAVAKGEEEAEARRIERQHAHLGERLRLMYEARKRANSTCP